MHRFTMILWILLVGRLFLSCSDLPLDDLPHSEGFEKVYDLPEELTETSGIIVWDSLFWTFNDSGDDHSLYGVDMQDGSIQKRISLNAGNVDWEDITQDEKHIYIGDFGNNKGNRVDLCIYILPKDSIEDIPLQSADVEKISYYYEDQEDYSEQSEPSEFDCESLFSYGDSLYLFTKNWQEDFTTLYQLPAQAGVYMARKIQVFETDGLITGADYNPESNELVLCGYKQFVPYLIYFGDANQLKLYETPKERTNFFDHFGLQVEGITIINDIIYLSAENSAETQAIFIYTPDWDP